MCVYDSGLDPLCNMLPLTASSFLLKSLEMENACRVSSGAIVIPKVETKPLSCSLNDGKKVSYAAKLTLHSLPAVHATPTLSAARQKSV
jgi:hypothetical protein